MLAVLQASIVDNGWWSTQSTNGLDFLCGRSYALREESGA